MKIIETKKIKDRVLYRMTTGIIIAITGMIGFSPMPVMAGGTEAECICKTTCSENQINPDCPVCTADYHYCEGKSTDDPGDLPKPEEEEEKFGPLTPDGNMTLVDDYGSIKAGGKQFITVVTKSGNYFYIIIDRDDKGTETVHFLNMVDESDLLALMEDEEVAEYIAAKGIGEEEEEPVVEEEPEPTEIPEETEPEPEPKKGNGGVLLLCILAGGAGVAGYIYYQKGKDSKKNNDYDPDLDYNEDIEDRLAVSIDEIDDDEVLTLDPDIREDEHEDLFEDLEGGDE